MRNTLINSNIGKFELLEIYEYYDGPIIFSCKNASGNFFFASAVDEDKGKKRWLFLPVSPFRLKQILTGCVSIKSAFIKTEEPWLFEMCGNFAGDNSFYGRILYVNEISHDDLPDDDVFLDDIDSSVFLKCLFSEDLLETSTINESVAIEYIARQTWSDILDIKIQTPISVPSGYISMDLLGRVLHQIQSLLYSTFHPVRGKIPSDIKEAVGLNVFAFSKGSFTVRTQSNQLLMPQEDLFSTILDIIDAGDSKQSLLNVINKVNLASISRYEKLLRALSTDDCGLEINWASPNGLTRLASLSPTQVRSIITLINLEDSLRKREFCVVGELVMVHSKKHRFELTDVDGFSYKGTVTKPLQKLKFEVSSFVEATLEESISTNAAKEKIYYSLLEVRELPTEEIGKLFNS